MVLNSIDYIILGILLLSTGISFMRGFLREVLSLLAWIAAVWLSVSFTPQLAFLLENQIANDSLRILIAFISLFVSTLIVASLVNFLVSQLVKKTGFSGTDRMIGVIFGLARGAIIVAVIVLVVGFTTVPQETWWQESLLLDHFQTLALWLKGSFPAEMTTRFAYDTTS